MHQNGHMPYVMKLFNNNNNNNRISIAPYGRNFRGANWVRCSPPVVSALNASVSGASVTNLNKPPRALAASTIAWVRS